MQTRASLLNHEFEKLITAEISRLKDNMAFSGPKTLEEYRFIAGQISGLQLGLEIIQEAESICDGKSRST